ncbi:MULTISPECIES: RimK family alpha-L-glutamate ligase [unclassified Rhizobacter]|uniref:ATP-grasp domain-containing protein n=1 Tax=unclassified Rhizobacter TaxID=2640088 RepID=UPI0006FDC63E|nr:MULTISPECIES: RimK family alpha-L-glutamate ligase [unclassified Rhizobacter]KQU77192.1 RimK family alpha-L-glutamate ligase [Rhizobacter sp. Root29]KQW12735.1 RimK family alpha-L-glutamate ligase [Rhizobacter sp. Root1238]KRB22323.1 RimK family alpha-L-glutamate ligase [Rhizobacter sp. Root16D2]
MRVAIMTDEVGWHTRQLQAALRARGAVGRCIDLADCHIDTTLAWHGLALPGHGRALPDAVLVRGLAGGSFEQVTKRLGVLHALRELGVPVYNDARAIERSVDKSMTSLLLHAAGVPTPPTWATESQAQARRIAMREGAAGHALVLKPLFGSQGKGLQLVGEVDGVHHALPALDRGFGSLAYLQRFVPATAVPGFDWRVLVVGGHAIAAMRRVSTHWIHNVAQGARCEPAELTPALAQLAEQAAAALDMDYAGVDLIPSAQGTQVIEVNGVAAWQGLQRVTGFNIARAIVDDLLDRRCALQRTLGDAA